MNEFDQFIDEMSLEDYNESDIRIEEDKFKGAVIWSTDWTTETLARQLAKGNIELKPSFQRRDAWDNKAKSRLIESLILGLPVPPIILAESKKRRNTYIVIDGKQRLLSIRNFYIDSEEEKTGFRSLKLTGLEILKQLNGVSYKNLGTIQGNYLADLDNQSIRTVVIKNWPNEDYLYTVFLRLNTSSKTLSPQELRQALKPGPFLDYLDNSTSQSDLFKRMLNNDAPDYRMKDVELALRYYAFKYCIENHNGNLKNLLDYTCEKFNKEWEVKHCEIEEEFHNLEEAIKFGIDVVYGEDVIFSRYINGKSCRRFNRSIFELFTFYFSDKNIMNCIVAKRDIFLEKFYALNDEAEFRRSVSDTTKEIGKIQVRFLMFSKMLKEVLGDSDLLIPYYIEENGRLHIEKY